MAAGLLASAKPPGILAPAPQQQSFAGMIEAEVVEYGPQDPMAAGLLASAPPPGILAPAPPQQGLAGMIEAEVLEYGLGDGHRVYEVGTGGLLWDVRMQYTSSWYLEGGTFSEDGFTYILQSTPDSNRASRMEDAFTYNHLQVYCQEGDVVSATNPMVSQAEPVGSVLDLFASRMAEVPWDGFRSMEDVFSYLGISYSRFICGYSLYVRGTANRRYCALDWYYQDHALRSASGRDVWYHAWILDQVCPSLWYKGSIIQIDPNEYRGWAGHALGQTYRYQPE